MELRSIVEQVRGDLKEDLEFFGYVTLAVCNNNECEMLFIPDEQVEGTGLYKLIDEYMFLKDHNYELEWRGNKINMVIKEPVKALDADAISTQGQVIKSFTRFLDNMVKEWDRLSNIELDDELEFHVDLSDESPFKKLTKSQVRNRNTIEKTYRLIPKFMYFEDELKVFKDEYDALIEAVNKTDKKRIARLLNKTLSDLEAVEMQDEEKEIKTLTDSLIKAFEKNKVEYDNSIRNIKSKKDLTLLLKDMISKQK